MAVTSAEEKYALITSNLQEVLNPEIITKILAEGRNPKIYWGTATTGRPHCGYLIPALKISDFLHADCEVTILLADLHGALDSMKSPVELVGYRAEYYALVIKAIFEAVGAPVDKLNFVLGSSYQKSIEYSSDFYNLAKQITLHDARKAGTEVVKQDENPSIGSCLYPILQVLDEEYLGADVQFGGMDQRKIFTAAIEWLPKLGYRQRAHLINPLLPGLQGSKMSASDPNSKIDLLDPPETVRQKIRKAECSPTVVEGNGILAFAKYVLIPAASLSGKGFRVERKRDGLEPLVYRDAKAMFEDYEKNILTPQLIKAAVTEALNDLLAPIQTKYEASAEWKDIELKAYPPPEEKKKGKKTRNLGSRFPGAKDAFQSDMSQPKPDAPQPKPDAPQPKPAASQPKPDAPQPKPAASQPKPDASQTEPDKSQTLPIHSQSVENPEENNATKNQV